MARATFLVVCAFTLLAYAASASPIVEHTFHIGNLSVSPLCQERVIVAVNQQFPGPTILVNEGDTLVVHVFNESPYNISIHWHGIFQIQTPWADGPSYVTQCPITPGNSYTYKFTVKAQEGTLWWHAHFSVLRATAYGALIIRPKAGRSYPFPKPYKEVPILLGEWWNANVVDVENEAQASGGVPNISDAFTINGKAGDLYSCSKKDTYKLIVKQGETYLLRIINAALNNQLFFKIAMHKLTVVAVDASYTTPYVTDVVVTAPGQTTDVLVTTDQLPGKYYMAALAYASGPGVPFDNTTVTGVLQYEGAKSSIPLMPTLPAFNDTPIAHRFYSKQTSLRDGPHNGKVPLSVDRSMLITIGFGLAQCPNDSCAGPLGRRLRASMNNASFELPSALSILEAHFYAVGGVFTDDFPSAPPVAFNYTNGNVSFDVSLLEPVRATRVKRLKYGEKVEVVFQNTALLTVENHPIHLHGFNFFVVGQGFGNYDPLEDSKGFNLDNPQERNTISVPVGGWAAVRFTANNPGVWLMHCHLDVHLPEGLATAFVVENGPTPDTTLPPPPHDLPRC